MEWIKTADKLPERGQLVLVATYYRSIMMGHFTAQQGTDAWTVYGLGRLEMESITHWATLPELPKILK